MDTLILTCVDRFTRWLEAVTIGGITSGTVARAFVELWLANVGCPSTITTDRGLQFEYGLFCCLASPLGITRSRETSCHPQANGSVERFHRQPKASPSTAKVSQWTDALPLVVHDIHNEVKADIGYTATELAYGVTIRLSGDFPDFSSSSVNMNVNSLANRLTCASIQLNLFPLDNSQQMFLFNLPCDIVHTSWWLQLITLTTRNSIRRTLWSSSEWTYVLFNR